MLERRGGRGAGALHDELRPLDQVHHRPRDLVVRDRDHLVDVLLEQPQRQLGGALHRDAVGDRPPGARLGLNAEHAQVGNGGLRGYRDTGREAPAADGDDDRAEAGHRAQDLRGDRPLARDDRRIAEGMEQRPPLGRGELARDLMGILVGAVDQADVAAVLANGLHLRHRRVRRHAERRAHAGALRRERDRLRMVARAGGHDAGRPLVIGEVRHRVRGAADLERAGHLEVLGLQEDGGARDLGELVRAEGRRLERVPGDRARRALDVVGGDTGIAVGSGHASGSSYVDRANA